MDKMALRSYECFICKKMITGYPALYRNKCKNLEMRSMVEKERLSTLTIKELREQKTLGKN